MTVRHLEIFLAVVDGGSMRKAAQTLFISQPTISGAIREIEQAYDVRLFERLNQRLHITPQGRQLAVYARQILSLFREMEYTLQHSAAHAILRIGATLTIGTCVLPEILCRLQTQTDIPTSVQVKNTRAVEEDLLTGALDIGFVEGEITHPDLVVLPVMQDALAAVAAKPAPPMTLAQFAVHIRFCCGKAAAVHAICLNNKYSKKAYYVSQAGYAAIHKPCCPRQKWG